MTQVILSQRLGFRLTKSGLDKVLERTPGMKQAEMEDGIELAVQQLIAKVDSSQALIDDLEAQIQDLRLQLQTQEIQYQKRLEEKDADFAAVVAPRLQKLQEELDYYYSLSRKQLELIQASEDLQARTARLLLGSDH